MRSDITYGKSKLFLIEPFNSKIDTFFDILFQDYYKDAVMINAVFFKQIMSLTVEYFLSLKTPLNTIFTIPTYLGWVFCYLCHNELYDVAILVSDIKFTPTFEKIYNTKSELKTNTEENNSTIINQNQIQNIVSNAFKPKPIGFGYTMVKSTLGFFTIADSNGKPLNNTEWFKAIRPMWKTPKRRNSHIG